MKEYINTSTGEVTEGIEFATVLLNLSEGASHRELTENLRELVQSVKETGKPGTLQYTIAIKPTDLSSGAVAVMDQIKLKKPEYARPKSLFFADKDGNLTRDPISQPSLFEQITGEHQ